MSRWYTYAPDWIAAIGTGGAFLVAASAYRTSVRDRHNAQARLVQAYMAEPVEEFLVDANGPSVISSRHYAGWHFEPDITSWAGESHDHYVESDCAVAKITLHNKSSEFAHSLEVELAEKTGPIVAKIVVATIAPDTALPLIAVLPNEPRMYDGLSIRLRFVDATGERWISETGRPVRVRKRRTRA